jgi:hypothetical protein
VALKEVPLPTGGRAWVRTRLSHERHSIYNAVIAGLSTLSARAKQLQAQADAGFIDESATAEMRSISLAVSNAKKELVELCTQRWDGVRGPDEPDRVLEFPSDLGQLDDEDFEALWDGIQAGVKEGRPDPKGSAPPSGSSSQPTTIPGPQTPQPTS